MAEAAEHRELTFTDTDFEKVRQLIHQRAGIALAMHKREMVYSRLARRLRALGHKSFKQYLQALEGQGEKGAEWEHFVNALTTNLTSFFREAHHFPLLAEHVRNRSEPVRIWCCAASTGEEPWSLAITLSEALGSRASNARIIATDIDTRALEVARQGIYPMNQIERLSEQQRKSYFQRGTGARSGMARINAALRAMVEFRPLNLLESGWGLEGQFDAIFCRNIMIYFDKPTQKKLLERFVPLLKDDGLLFAGHSENFTYLTDAFRLRGHTVYEQSSRRRMAS
ncbi:CheR family methyltransferase [Kushneria phosphatilytica]|uniref:CheR family methyltransferase n=1 Tax=Kushneria phosphatilytica TaxID=657387 RepID=UPI0008D9D49D|nr:CheR family methyltransferase [Kushneria phosphatilytica]OHV12036.1 chemotaxis protein CheR [Kushneria phosphatilytica]